MVHSSLAHRIDGVPPLAWRGDAPSGNFDLAILGVTLVARR
jgi:hypothetical protein